MAWRLKRTAWRLKRTAWRLKPTVRRLKRMGAGREMFWKEQDMSTDWLPSRREVDGDNGVGGRAKVKTEQNVSLENVFGAIGG